MTTHEHETRDVKRLNFADVVLFDMPADWIVQEVDLAEPEDPDDRELVIFDDVPGSGTLRPWTELYRFQDEAGLQSSLRDLHLEGIGSQLRDNVMLSYAVSDGLEDGEVLRLHRWTVTIRIGKDHLRVIIFTHTIDAQFEGSSQAEKEILIVRTALLTADYPESERR